MARWMAEEAGRRFAERHPDWTVVQLPLLPLGADELPLPGSVEVSGEDAVRGAAGARAEPRARRLRERRGDQRPRRTAPRGGARGGVSQGEQAPRHPHVHARRSSSCTASSRADARARVEELLGRSLSERERTALLRGEHAGAWETSFMLAERPELVEPGHEALVERQPPAFAPLARWGERLAAMARARRRGRPQDARGGGGAVRRYRLAAQRALRLRRRRDQLQGGSRRSRRRRSATRSVRSWPRTAWRSSRRSASRGAPPATCAASRPTTR